MTHASTTAEMAFANAFLGVCHSMANKLGANPIYPLISKIKQMYINTYDSKSEVKK